MSVILLANWKAARQARDLAECMSSDPQLRHWARVRAMRSVARRAARASNPRAGLVIYLDTPAAWRRARLIAALRRGLENV